MIEIIKHPGTIAAGQAEHGLSFYGNSLHMAKAFEAQIEVDESNLNGESFILTFGNGAISLTFTTKLSPADNGLEIPEAATKEQLAAVFESNYILNKYYIITTETTVGSEELVIIVSRGKGSFYDMLTDFSLAEDHFLYTNIEPGLDATLPDNYQSVWGASRNGETLFDGFMFDIPPSLEQYLDLGKFFSKKLAYPYPHADITEMLTIACDELQLWTAEYFNGGYQKRYTWSAFKYLPFAEPTEDYLSTLAASEKFIHPAPRQVWESAPWFLYYLGMSVSKSYLLKAVISYTDNTSTTRNILGKVINQGDLLIIPAGITALNLNSYNPEKTIWSYKLQLFDATTQVATTETIYRIETPEFAECFYFRTNKSVFHHLLNCQVKRSLETTGKEIRQGNDIDFQVEQSSLDFEVLSSPMFLDEVLLVEEGLKNNNWLWLIDGEMVKVGLLPGSFLIFDQGEDIHRVSFKVRKVAEIQNIVAIDMTEASGSGSSIGSGSGSASASASGTGSGSGAGYTYLQDGTNLLDDGTNVLGF